MRPATRRPHGLFVGLCTLDVIQLVDHVPGVNEKLTAREQTIAAGGPAANAAAAFGHVGGAATLLSRVGAHPLAEGIRADLDALDVTLVDLAAQLAVPPTVSSILVTAATGERAVASTDAASAGLPLAQPGDLDALIAAADIVELDGHHGELALAVARAARAVGRRTLLDGGRWRTGVAALLPHVDVAVCSADFHPPGTRTVTDTLEFLLARGVGWAAISRGREPIVWAGLDGSGTIEVPPTAVVDTLGAGDVLHGALAHQLSPPGPLDAERFAFALRRAAALASRSCASFGTRAWMLS